MKSMTAESAPAVRETDKTQSEVSVFEITEKEKEQALQAVDRAFIDSTLFIVPDNDGEARRANDILKAVNAPHLITSRQQWGATLGKEIIAPEQLSNVKRIVIFEMPDVATEERLRAQGFDMVIIDHHFYKGLDRRQERSSLEQLMDLIKWPASAMDEAIAANDRSYIPGLKKMGLSVEKIRQIRRYDLMAQGRSGQEVDDMQAQARALIPQLKRHDGVYIVTSELQVDHGILKQELAIESKSGEVDTLILKDSEISFSGSPHVVKALLAFNFETLGYAHGSYAQYGGGDPQASMFFGFKPTQAPGRAQEALPPVVVKAIEAIVFSQKEKSMTHSETAATVAITADAGALNGDVIQAQMLPRGSALMTSSGALATTGITSIIHAATGAMTRSGGVFEPTLESIASSVKASLDLARVGGHRRVAIPFIGGGIFVDRLGTTPQKLADTIVQSALREAHGLELRFVTFGDADTSLFQNALSRASGSVNTNASVLNGSITDFRLHGASAIVNAANTEVIFGGGLSGVIARATGDADQINREAHDKVISWLKTLSTSH